MPVTLGVNFLSLGDLIAEARTVGPDWKMTGANAHLVVKLPEALMATLSSDATRVSLEEDPLPNLNTAVIALSPSPYADKGRISVGRATVCDVVLPLPGLSKLHAFVTEVSPDTWIIEDAGSKNGTFLNGVRLAAQTPAPLIDGMQIMLGDVETRFWLLTSLSSEISWQAAGHFL